MVSLLQFGCAVAQKPAAPPLSHETAIQKSIVAGAREQLGWGTVYDASYYRISYPNGDVPKTKGVCTDVVIRSFRYAGYDLQKLIHEDMGRAWKAYPRYPGRSKSDTNIDHRRVPNQMAFFRRHALTCSRDTNSPASWQPGDVIDWKLENGLDHTGILTDRRDTDGFPFVIHNIGEGPQEEDVLRTPTWKITGHFRYPGEPN